MTSNLDNHKSKYSLIPYIGAAIIGVSIIWFNYTNFTSSSEYIESSNAHRASGNYKAAFDDLNTAIKLDSKNPQLYIDRAEVREKLGDESGVIEDYKKAIQIDPNNKDNYLFNLTSSWNTAVPAVMRYSSSN
jgi:tetratricopeptide (TPR) repeat protein